MKKAQPLEYPASSIQTDWRTSPAIIPGKDVASYSRANRSIASRPERLVSAEDAQRIRRDVNGTNKY